MMKAAMAQLDSRLSSDSGGKYKIQPIPPEWHSGSPHPWLAVLLLPGAVSASGSSGELGVGVTRGCRALPGRGIPWLPTGLAALCPGRPRSLRPQPWTLPGPNQHRDPAGAQRRPHLPPGGEAASPLPQQMWPMSPSSLSLSSQGYTWTQNCLSEAWAEEPELNTQHLSAESCILFRIFKDLDRVQN